MLLDRFAPVAVEALHGNNLSRRTFLRAGAAAGGGLLLSLSLPFSMQGAEAAGAAGFAPNAFVRIDRDGQVTLIIPQVEMGQGTYTSMPMLGAEELEGELGQVLLHHEPDNHILLYHTLLRIHVTR